MRIKRARPVFFLACTIAIIVLSSPALCAASPYPFSWENDHSVRAALVQQEGQSVICEASVAGIAARNNPSYFILKDEWRAKGEHEARIVVLCRPPINLTGVVRVAGTLGRLPNSEPCILNPTVEALFDKEGRPIYWSPFLKSVSMNNWHVLPIPTGDIPACDPGLPNNGTGIAGQVTAYPFEGVSRYETVASLLASAPVILSRVEISAKPIKSVADGYIIAGDDTTDAQVKIYTNNPEIKATDRIVKASGVVHSDDGGRICLYAGSGVSPYFDAQGFDALGSVTVASPGSVAYASTLGDTTPEQAQSSALNSSGVGAMDTYSPTSSDGSWVYLTGQVVTAVGQYYSYDIAGHDWIPVYYVQGIDKTPGIRVLGTSEVSTGNIVDVMARIDTKDGERILGIMDPWDSNSVECKVLDSNGTLLPRPFAMSNRALGGASIAYNPGIVGDPYGLYNIGSYVTVYGKVLESGPRYDGNENQVAGPYQFDLDSSYSSEPYIRIDDGSGVPSGNSGYGGSYGNKGIIVFGANADNDSNPVNVGDYVIVTGIGSIWKPDGSIETYRAIRIPNSIRNVSSAFSVNDSSGSGTISGTITLYDMDPNAEPGNVTVYCSSGKMQTIPVTRTGSVGTASYCFDNLPTQSNGEAASYIISAKYDGYKTRSYTGVTPGTARNVYLVPARKIYMRTQGGNNTIGPCSPSSINIGATVLKDNHQPVAQGSSVRFATTAGSFNPAVLQQTITALTNASGAATVTLYGVKWSGVATVTATDDLTTPEYANTADDTYRCDWEKLPYDIEIKQPSVSLQLTPELIECAICDNPTTLTAALKVCGSAKSEEFVTFHATNGTFAESGGDTAMVRTGADGIATATLLRPSGYNLSTGEVYATASPYGVDTKSNIVNATWHGWQLSITVTPDWVLNGRTPPAEVKVVLTRDDDTYVGNQYVTLTTDQGHFENNQQTYIVRTNTDGEINTTLAVDDCPVTAHITASTIPCGGSALTSQSALKVVCGPLAPCEIFFVLDCTQNMWPGQRGAQASVAALLTEMRDAYGIPFRAGGIKLNDPYPYGSSDDPLLNMAEFKSISSFVDVDSFISNWVNDGYQPWGDSTGLDLELDGLYCAAQDMRSYASSVGHKYIVLITDFNYHDATEPDPKSLYTVSQIAQELTTTGCPVYITLWPGFASDSAYTGLAVNGGELDYGEVSNNDTPGHWKYPLQKLRARILNDY